MTVAAVALCIGMLLVAVAGIFVLLVLGDLRALWILYRLRPAPIGTRGRVAVAGITEYGTAGRQIAPVSGADCAWYQVTVVRSPSRSFYVGDDPDYDVILEAESPSWPAVTDRTHRIPVDPRLLLPHQTSMDPVRNGPPVHESSSLTYTRAEPVPLPPIVPTDVIDGLRESERLHLSEARILPGVPIFAIGRVTGKGLRPNRARLTVLSTSSRTEVIAARRADLRFAVQGAIWLAVLGLVLAVPSALHLIPLPG